MKKFLALLSALAVIAVAFASCAKNGTQEPSQQPTEPEKEPITAVTNASGESFYPVTDENGNAVRNGESIAVYVTDANGNPIENQTEMQTFLFALEVGNRIEMPSFRITVPEGWADARSFTELNLGNAETLDMISVSVISDMTLEEKRGEIDRLLSSIEKKHESAVIKTEAITVAGEEAVFRSGYIVTQNEAVYLGYITFVHGGEVYDCRISADRSLSEQEITEMVDILKSIEFVR